MNDSIELLTLRLVLIGIIFFFVIAAAFALRSGLRPRAVPLSRPAAPERRPMGPRLVLLSPASTGIAPGTEFYLAGEMTLGRDGTNGIVLPDASVSGRHALLEHTNRGWRVADLGSTNGTVVNGRTLDGRAVPLQGGEQIVLGAVVLRFQP